MKIMKFGGSSVGDAARIRGACEIVNEARATEKIATVFSAMKGITNSLIATAREAEQGDQGYLERLAEIDRRHKETARLLLDSPGEAGATLQSLDDLTGELRGILHGIELVRECTLRSMDLVMSFGERLSNIIIAAYLSANGTPAEFVDARECIITDHHHGSAVVNFEVSGTKIRKRLKAVKGIPVITGFIASTPEGVTTTLGRNGSDFTASIIGAALGAKSIEIWTDVDGVLSADPRYVSNAFVINQVSVEEAMELSYFGAEVIHPYTMIPAVENNIPIWIKNTMNPQAPGTLIARNVERHRHPITGIASIENCSLINVEGGGMLGVPGIASRVFQALARAEINIIMISQASSEHSICLVCRSAEAGPAAEALEAELAWELDKKKINRVEILNDLEIIAVIGENMRGTPGMSGKLFSSLGQAQVNVLAIAQGSSERNISFVVRGSDRQKALTVVHNAFLEQEKEA
ncbi:MAG: aspartate kinase [Spirochaetales bacterium]|nr:aspartate kinase [Spirochaetales bacterium]